MLIIILLIILALLILFTKLYVSFDKKSGICSQKCNAIDDVNNPIYNIKETIKNTLLIEDHLANKNKYCQMCLVKHFLLNIGYIEEALWMACGKKYDNLEESLTFFKQIFKTWEENKDSDEIKLETLTQIRDWRRSMIEKYYFET